VDFDIRHEEIEWKYLAGEHPDVPGKMELIEDRFSHSEAQRSTMLG
jgi:hypothetical protein